VFARNYDEAQAQLQNFAPWSGVTYARRRNYDLGSPEKNQVSYLSPALRHRLLLEEEVVSEVLAQHSFSEVEKFIQEVCWRTYFKGYLEQRPGLWHDYLEQVKQLLGAGLGSQEKTYRQALEGETGIAAFDHWVQELKQNHYLHNHARMWFASIWIFTLRLPWALGAHLFLQNLLDGDPASNTLSWRWVAGLHTRGKCYVARASNIAQYTEGRFHPSGLNENPIPVAENETRSVEPLTALPTLHEPEPTSAVVVTEDDLMSREIQAWSPRTLIFLTPRAYPQVYSEEIVNWKLELMTQQARWAKQQGHQVTFVDKAEGLASLLSQQEFHWLEPPQGFARDHLLAAGFRPATSHRRAWDQHFYPHCTAGFFKLKKQISKVINKMELFR
jgi:deoxyribodipyrimidine photo-lyase